MGTEYYLLFLPKEKNYIPTNKKIKSFIEYLEKEKLINPSVNALFRHYTILKKNPNNKPPFENIWFKTWVELKKEILTNLRGDITNTTFFIETSEKFDSIFLKHNIYLTPNGFGTIGIGISDPPREYSYGDAYKKGETSFSIEIHSRPGPHNLDAEKKFFKALQNDKDFMKILTDFESLLGTKLKLDSHWSW